MDNLREKDSSFKGVGLLDSSRIKAMSSDIAHNIRNLHERLEGDQAESLSIEEKTDAMQRCVDNVYAVVPHHCGDHRQCSTDTCLYKQIKRQMEARKYATGKDWTTDDVRATYAQNSRLRGQTLSIGKTGRVKLVGILKKYITIKNIERLAQVLSSNVCENYFSCLVKYSQGKRINYGQKDTWEVIQLFVAGLRSDPDFTTKVLLDAGGVDTQIRRKIMLRMRNDREKKEVHKASPKSQSRRRMYHQVKLVRMAKEDDKKCAHRPHKLPPTDDCKSSNKGKKRKAPTCSNCGRPGHKKPECEEPSYDEKLKSKCRKGLLSEAQLIDLFDV